MTSTGSTMQSLKSLCRTIFSPCSDGYQKRPTMSGVDQMLADLVKREGGYVNNPNDRGGPTRYGITQQTAKAFGYTGDMRMLPVEKAQEIYRHQYWVDPHFYDVSLRYERLAEKLFDCGVNMGPKIASRFLQRSLNILNKGASEYPDVPEDGQLGQMSLAALDAYKQHRGDQGEAVLLKAINALQAVRYIEIAEKDPAQETFIFGWLANRVELAH